VVSPVLANTPLNLWAGVRASARYTAGRGLERAISNQEEENNKGEDKQMKKVMTAGFALSALFACRIWVARHSIDVASAQDLKASGTGRRHQDR
jgi:hypothetical protein